MANNIVITRGRTVTLSVSLPYDISNDTFVSQIRTGRGVSSPLIATWSIEFNTDGKDGKLIFTLDDSITSEITHLSGYMDIKRISDGEPTNVFDSAIPVAFKEPVTT